MADKGERTPGCKPLLVPETAADAYAARDFVMGLRCFQMVFGLISMALAARCFAMMKFMMDDEGGVLGDGASIYNVAVTVGKADSGPLDDLQAIGASLSGGDYSLRVDGTDDSEALFITGPKMAITAATLALVWSIFATLFSHTKLGAVGFLVDAALGVILIAAAALEFSNSPDFHSTMCTAGLEFSSTLDDFAVKKDCSGSLFNGELCFKSTDDQTELVSDLFKYGNSCTIQIVSGVFCLFQGLSMFTTVVSGFGVFKKKDLLTFDDEI